MATTSVQRRLPIGAEVQSDGVHFRVWAPRRRRVEVVLDPRSAGEAAPSIELQPDGQGYFAGVVHEAADGTRYRFRLDDESTLYPDPASRFQPEGVHGPSQVIDPSRYVWRDRDWKGVHLPGQVIYEMHVGTFTNEGTYAAAMRELPELADLGVTVVELMPVAEFPGRFGWGYDGVDLFAPTRLYGTPDDLRRFVNEAHRHGIGVLLDVVYNHFGPSGNYLGAFSADFQVHDRPNEWGQSLNFDGENAGPVREFFVANAGYWIDEFHMDGLRLDATQAIHDSSVPHILADVSRRVREAAGGRATLITSENERQETIQVRPIDQGGYGLDAVWNDDFHHAARVALTGNREYYYADYRGTPQELISAVKWGYLFQGQHCTVQQGRRGSPSMDLPAAKFITFLQNHDQVSNSARGLRIHQLTSPGCYRAMTGFWLLAPATPMLFQGQEFAASSPFLYFADHDAELAALVRKGRFEFLRRFGSDDALADVLPDPESVATFERCKLDFSERERHAEAYALHRDFMRLRKEDAIFRRQRGERVHGAVLSSHALVLRLVGEGGNDRLVCLNLGADLTYSPMSEPLLAPPLDRQWELVWSSDHPRYGGSGRAPLAVDDPWFLPGRSTLVLAAVPRSGEPRTL